MSLPSPAEVMASINDMANALDTASKEQYAAVLKLAEAEMAYRRGFEEQIVRIKIDADKGPERMPAEDVRKAMAHSLLEPGVYEDYISAAAHVDAMKARARAIEAAMNGKQSVLKTLAEEARHG